MESNQKRVDDNLPGPSGEMVWDVLTMFVWLGMAGLVIAVAAIIVNPAGALKPFPPLTPTLPTLVSAIVLPEDTPTPGPVTPETPDPSAPAARTQRSTRTPTPTFTPVTPTVTYTPTLEPTWTFTPGPSPTPTIYSLYPFIVRGEVNTLAASTFPDHDQCKLWVAGQAVDTSGAPMVGITVALGGYLDGKNLYQLSLTGTALQYGPAGYEFTVADAPVRSRQSVWVQLFDQASIPLSAKVYFDTIADCQQNLVLINFRQVR